MIDTKAIQRLWEIDHERRLKEANNILEPVYHIVTLCTARDYLAFRSLGKV